MFCPVGYRSAAELWPEFRTRLLEAVYLSALQTYDDRTILPTIVRGSPLDICEHLFLRSMAEIGVHLASPRGEVVRIHVDCFDHLPNLFSRIPPYRAGLATALAFLNSSDPDFESKFTGDEYKDWDMLDEAPDVWSKQYGDFEERKRLHTIENSFGLVFNSIPNFVLRPSFVIAETAPPWADDAKCNTIRPILESFGGWAVCITSDEYETVWQKYLAGERGNLDHMTVSEDKKKTGRPGLDAAKAAFEAIGCEKGNASWEQIARRLESATGQKPTAKTLRRWREAYQFSAERT